MARFLGTAAGRTAGADQGKPAFTRVQVFSTPGTTTFDLPSDVKKAKVFVIGAGSCYRPGLYCFLSDNCFSGVDFPRQCYCMCFCGHLTGAGGGYAEKTYSSSVAGKTLTINVGSPTGLTASSVAVSGENTVTASNATEAVHSWSCTNNSSARDNSVDNPNAFDFCLPRCGYANYISGYYNFGGTASGGDINRSGGRGILIPQFLYDGYIDGVTCIGGGAGSGGNTSSCWINPAFNCQCILGYHYVFGSYCGFNNGWSRQYSCGCWGLCAAISNMCYCAGLCSRYSSRFSFAGLYSTKCTCSIAGEITGGPGGSNFANDSLAVIKERPTGIGAQSGNSADNGRRGESEQVVVSTSLGINRSTSGGGGGSCCYLVQYSHYSSGYDYSFGGTQLSCYCANYYPGCFSTCYAFKGNTVGAWCYRCIGTGWTYVFGSNFSGTAHCFCSPYGLTQCSSLDCTDCRNKFLNIGFSDMSVNTADGHVIPLSTLVSGNDGNVSDIKYGYGATLDKVAGYGGGGNRLNPAGGQGLVVLVY